MWENTERWTGVTVGLHTWEPGARAHSAALIEGRRPQTIKGRSGGCGPWISVLAGASYLSGAASGRPQRQLTRAETVSVVSSNLNLSRGVPMFTPAPNGQPATAEVQALFDVVELLLKS